MARTKEVFPVGEIAHLWAHQKHPYGRDGISRFYFRGRTIYSYGAHFPIATLDEKDPDIVWFTDQTYSSYTSKHVHKARYAVSHKRIITVMWPPEDCDPYTDKDWQMRQINHFVHLIKMQEDPLRKARKPEKYMDIIAGHIQSINTLVSVLKIKLPKYIQELIANPSLSALSTLSEKEKVAMERRRKAKAKEQERRNREAYLKARHMVGMWKRHMHRGDNPDLPLVSPHDFSVLPNTYLRTATVTSSNPEECHYLIETSKGIFIPEEEAKAYYYTVKKILQHGHDQPMMPRFKGYRVDVINKDHLVVGCHDIPMQEIEEIAKAAGWAV